MDELNAGRSYIPDVPAIDIAALVKQNLLRATTDYAAVREADAVFICVPTPYDAGQSARPVVHHQRGGGHRAASETGPPGGIAEHNVSRHHG